jgi:hypothetical protein
VRQAGSVVVDRSNNSLVCLGSLKLNKKLKMNRCRTKNVVLSSSFINERITLAVIVYC